MTYTSHECDHSSWEAIIIDALTTFCIRFDLQLPFVTQNNQLHKYRTNIKLIAKVLKQWLYVTVRLD